MADVKISQLPPATTPVAGTEVLPIVQSGTTSRVSLNNATGITRPFTANGVVYASSTSALTTGSALTYNGTGLGVGISSAGYLVDISTPLTGTTVGSNVALNLESQASGRDVEIRMGDTVNSSGRFGYLSGSLYWAFGSTEQMRLTSTGLGIGTTRPKGKLTISATSTTLGDQASSNINLGGAGANNERVQILLGAVSYSNTYAPVSIGYITTDQGGNCKGAITFATRDVTTDSAPTERARITSGGDLLVGTTSSDGRLTVRLDSTTASPQYIVNAAATGTFIKFEGNGSVLGSITFNGSNTAYNTSSDYRLKNITGPITNSGAYIDSLKPVEGTWKADGSTFVGLIAHEVQEVSRTQVATGEKDGEQMQAMDYSSSEIIANLIAEVQSLRKRLAALEAK